MGRPIYVMLLAALVLQSPREVTAYKPYPSVEISHSLTPIKKLSLLDQTQPIHVYRSTGAEIHGQNPVTWVYELQTPFSVAAASARKELPWLDVQGDQANSRLTEGGVRSSFELSDGRWILGPDAKRGDVRDGFGNWTTIVIREEPLVEEAPGPWPKEATSGPIAKRVPPLALVEGKTPDETAAPMAQGAYNEEFVYVFKEPVAELDEQLKAAAESKWMWHRKAHEYTLTVSPKTGWALRSEKAPSRADRSLLVFIWIDTLGNNPLNLDGEP